MTLPNNFFPICFCFFFIAWLLNPLALFCVSSQKPFLCVSSNQHLNNTLIGFGPWILIKFVVEEKICKRFLIRSHNCMRLKKLSLSIQKIITDRSQVWYYYLSKNREYYLTLLYLTKNIHKNWTRLIVTKLDKQTTFETYFSRERLSLRALNAGRFKNKLRWTTRMTRLGLTENFETY